MAEPNIGRVNIALYNSYDKLKLCPAHRRALYRAAPIAYANSCNLLCVDFPLKELSYDNTIDLATQLASDTTIGKNGEYLIQLAKENRLYFVKSNKNSLSPQYGKLVVCTSKPNPAKKISARRLMRMIKRGHSCVFLIGLGRQGLPKAFFEHSELQFDVTGQNIPLETCTAISAVTMEISALLREYEKNPKLTVDVIIKNDNNEVVLVKRKNYPFKDHWAIPGGFVKYNERVEDAAMREIKEETGLDIELTQIFGVFSKPGRDPRGHIVTVCYLGKVKGDYHEY